MNLNEHKASRNVSRPNFGRAVVVSFGLAFCTLVLVMLGTMFLAADDASLSPGFARTVFSISFLTFISAYVIWRVYKWQKSRQQGN
jgi:hypothetical protein